MKNIRTTYVHIFWHIFNVLWNLLQKSQMCAYFANFCIFPTFPHILVFLHTLFDVHDGSHILFPHISTHCCISAHICTYLRIFCAYIFCLCIIFKNFGISWKFVKISETFHNIVKNSGIFQITTQNIWLVPGPLCII